MTQKNISISFCFMLAKCYTQLNRRLDSRLGGLGFNELIILSFLHHAENQKMRRIDLAEKIGFTASGVTRLLLPMEKIGLVSREINEQDARVSYAVLTKAGNNIYKEGLERLDIFCEDLLPKEDEKKISTTYALLDRVSKNL